MDQSADSKWSDLPLEIGAPVADSRYDARFSSSGETAQFGRDLSYGDVAFFDVCPPSDDRLHDSLLITRLRAL